MYTNRILNIIFVKIEDITVHTGSCTTICIKFRRKMYKIQNSLQHMLYFTNNHGILIEILEN